MKHIIAIFNLIWGQKQKKNKKKTKQKPKNNQSNKKGCLMGQAKLGPEGLALRHTVCVRIEPSPPQQYRDGDPAHSAEPSALRAASPLPGP